MAEEEIMDNETYEYALKIPKERIAVLIGKDGETKAIIEENTGVDIDVDSKEGEVTVSGTDALDLLTVREIVRAIGRGFNPDIALLLLKSDYALELVSIRDFAKTSNDALRLKGRVIGKEGKARTIIEQLTECYISVYGKTIAIIGETERLSIARKAVEQLLKGSQHARIFTWLERQRRRFKQDDFLKSFEPEYDETDEIDVTAEDSEPHDEDQEE